MSEPTRASMSLTLGFSPEIPFQSSEGLAGDQAKPAATRTPVRKTQMVEKPLVMSATITDLCAEPLFFSSYLSDEEEESASEADNMSFSTVSTTNFFEDEFLSDFTATFPELLAEECNLVKQQCEHAQAIKLFAAGRPKVVNVAKVNIHSSPVVTSPQPQAKGSARIVSARHQHIHDLSRSSSSSSYSSSSSSMPSTPASNYGIGTPSSASTPITPITPSTPNSVSGFDPLARPTRSDNCIAPSKSQIRFRNEYQYFPKPHHLAARANAAAQKPNPAPSSAPVDRTVKSAARPSTQQSPIFSFPIAKPRYDVKAPATQTFFTKRL